MPGFRGKPAVTTTTAAPFISEKSSVPVILNSCIIMCAASDISRAFALASPCFISTITTSASPFSAILIADVAPTFPAPIIATFILFTFYFPFSIFYFLLFS